MIVSKKGGEVYSFGSGNYGKLGIATRNDLKDQRTNIDSANPANVRDIDGEPLELGELPDFAIKQGKLDIRSVSCYSNHSLALSRDGNIYSWGNGGSGRLATGDTDDQPVAKIVESIQSQFTAERAIGDDSVGGGGDGEDDDDEDDAGGGGSQGDGSLRDLLQRGTVSFDQRFCLFVVDHGLLIKGCCALLCIVVDLFFSLPLAFLFYFVQSQHTMKTKVKYTHQYQN